MKKVLLSLTLFTSLIELKSQILDEGFETSTFPPTGWSIQTTNSSFTWAHTASFPVSGAKSADVAYDPSSNQDEKLITPSFSLAGLTNVSLKFKTHFNYYWAVTPNNNYDTIVKISTDGGSTWSQIWSENDIVGATAGFRTYDVTIPLNSFVGQSNVKIAFNYVGLDGAQWMLDDVNITASTLSVAEAKGKDDELFISPNPVRDSFKINIAGTSDKNINNVTITDASGKIVKVFTKNESSYNVSDLNAGTYFVTISNSNSGKVSKKVIKE